MLRTELDKIPLVDLLEMPEDTEVDEGFRRDFWKPLWIQTAETWFEDGSQWYDYAVSGFKGWAQRTDFEIYCDLRFSRIEEGEIYDALEMGRQWAELVAECAEIGKFS